MSSLQKGQVQDIEIINSKIFAYTGPEVNQPLVLTALKVNDYRNLVGKKNVSL
jgi:hypothetical protein